MDNSSYHGLAFLLSLGTLPIACTVEKGESETDGATTGGPTTDDTGSGTTGTTGGSDGMTTSGTTTTEPTSGTSSPTTGGETETGGPLGPCEAYVAKLIMCEPDLDMAEELDGCEAERKQQEAIVGPTCAALYDEVLLCYADAMCGDESACDAELEAAYACSPEIGPVCQAYGMKYGECFMQDPAETSKYCQTNLNSVKYMVGPECGAAYEDYYVCMTGLDCAALEMGMGCQDELAATETACGF